MRSRLLTPLVASTLVVGALAPASANAGLLSSLLKKKATPAKTATPPKAATPVTTPVNPVAPVVTPVVTPVTNAVTNTAAAAAAVTTAAVSEMTETCSETPTFKAFSAFGDTADYAFAPGGSFESGAAGWSLDGASVVNTNESIGVFGGTKALRISDGGRVVSPWFCVTPDHPHFRFVTFGGEVELEIDYKVIGDSDIDDDLVGETNSGSRWEPSGKHELATEIPSSKLAKGVLARVILEAEDDIFVDNVLIDPYRRG